MSKQVAVKETKGAVQQTNMEVNEMTEHSEYRDIIKLVEDEKISKSDAFRTMYEKGATVGQIAKMTNSHYSFVYGVIAGTFGSVKTKGKSGPSRSDKIRELADLGKTPGEIARELNANYSFVHSVVKKHRLQKEMQAEQQEQAR